MILSAQKRESSKKSEITLLRKKGNIPAVVYGPGSAPQSVWVVSKEFLQVFEEAGESSLVDFSLDGASLVKVLIKDTQQDPVTEAITHVDFFQVDMNKPLEAEVAIEFVGQSPAVKELGGILNKQLEEVSIRCLPADLVHSVTVDLSCLATFDDLIYIKDLVFPGNVEVLDNPDEVVVMVSEPISEEELKAMEQAPVETVAAEPVAEKSADAKTSGGETPIKETGKKKE